MSVPPIAIFCPAFVGCNVSAPVPETLSEKLISLAVKFSELVPAAKVEPKAIVASPGVKLTGAFNVTGPLKLMLSLVVATLSLTTTVPAPF